MKKACFLFSLLISLSVYSQKANPKTIFQAFNVDNTSCSMSARVEGEEEGMVAPVEETLDISSVKKNSAELLAAKDRIAQHLISLHIPDNRPVRLYDFFKKGNITSYLEKQGSDYTLYTKDKKVIWKKKFGYTDKIYHDTEGFNVYNNTNFTSYYDMDGKLISDGKYEYVERDHGDYFRVLKDKKWGLIDRTGKLLVPVKYDYVSHFLFNNKIYYVIREEGTDDYYLAADLKKKIFIVHNQSPPRIIKNRYWLLSGKVYDPVTNKRLFCKIPGYIEQATNSDLLTVRAPEGGSYFFDFEGNLLNGNTSVSDLAYAGKDMLIVSIHDDKDPTIARLRLNPSKKGLAKVVNGKLQWITKPVYFLLQNAVGYDFFLYSSVPGPQKKGVLDKTGKVIIPEDTYDMISTSHKKEWLLAVKDTSSILFNPYTRKTIPLKQRFISMYPLSEDSSFTVATTKTGAYILDKSYNALDLPVFALVNYDYSSSLVGGTPFKGPSNRKIYFDKNWKRKQFTINDSVFNEFVNLAKLDKDKYFIELPDGRRFIQTGNNKILQTPYRYVKYDTVAHWYIGQSAGQMVGTFDSTGATIIPFTSVYIEPFSPSSGFARLSLDFSRNQLISTKGDILFDVKYDDVWPIDHNNFIVTLGDRKGIVDKTGRIIIPVQYQYISVGQGRINVKENDYAPNETYDLHLLLRDP